VRPHLAFLVTLSFLAALFAPVRTSWACPDGTACVAERDGAWVCPGGACQSEASCCQVSRPNACKHGALPGSAPGKAGQPAVSVPDHCSFSVLGVPHPNSLIERASKVLFVQVALITATESFELPAGFAPAWLAVDSLGYRPPPHLSSGPSRAPPSA
jgi:hypothetical protein